MDTRINGYGRIGRNPAFGQIIGSEARTFIKRTTRWNPKLRKEVAELIENNLSANLCVSKYYRSENVEGDSLVVEIAGRHIAPEDKNTFAYVSNDWDVTKFFLTPHKPGKGENHYKFEHLYKNAKRQLENALTIIRKNPESKTLLIPKPMDMGNGSVGD